MSIRVAKQRKKNKTHTGTYTQGMLRRLQFAQVDLPSHLIFRPKLGRHGQYRQTGADRPRGEGRTSAKLASHRRPSRGDLLVPWVEDGVLLLLLLVLLVVVVLRRGCEMVGAGGGG